MLTTIGFIAIFAAIVLFFRDELSKSLAVIKARPWLFLSINLGLASSLIVSCYPGVRWLVLNLWACSLMLTANLVSVLKFMGQTLALWLASYALVLIVSFTPIIAVAALIRYKKPFFKTAQVWRRLAHEGGFIVGIVLLIMLGLQL